MLYDFAEKYSIKYNNCGKMIVLNDYKDNAIFESLEIKSKENGLSDIRILSSKESKLIEPRVKCIKSLWIPSAGIIDSHGVMSKLENLSITRGVNVAYSTKLNSIEKKNSYFKLIFNNEDEITAGILINSAGLWSQEVSEMLGINDYKIEYFKGEYYKSRSMKNLSCLIYPLPTEKSLGIHSVLSLNGEVSFGPNIYKVEEIDYKINNQFKKQFLLEINKYLNIDKDDIFEDFSGIRPKIKFDGIFNDFIINNESNRGFKNLINLVGIDSPGLTSSLAIAEYVESIIMQ